MKKNNKILTIILILIVLFIFTSFKKEYPGSSASYLNLGPPYTFLSYTSNWEEYVVGTTDTCDWRGQAYACVDSDIFTWNELDASGIATGEFCQAQGIYRWDVQATEATLGVKHNDNNEDTIEFIDIPATCLDNGNSIYVRLFLREERYTQNYHLDCCSSGSGTSCVWQTLKTFRGRGSGYAPPDFAEMSLNYVPANLCNNPADTNSDCNIILSEVISYATLWVNNQGISLTQVITVANTWVGGGSY